ncbi:MAG TPA: FliH/SctL family protein [Stellaceae bacterium]|nr:FliH/SctL family protein [Stellaceae bacterium]
MTARLDLAGASVLPFPFPALGDETPVAGIPVPSPSPAPSGGDVVDEGAAAVEPVAVETAAMVASELAAARDEGLQQGLTEGRERGYETGFAEGVKAGEAKMMEAVKRMAAIVGMLGAPLPALEQRVEEAVAALALEVARWVIGDEVGRSREFLVKLVRDAVGKVPIDMGAPRVLLNPADLDLVRSLAPEIDAGGALLVGDDTIEIGGALVVADGDERQIKDRRWNPRTSDGVSQVNLTLSSRWRAAMLTLFDGEDEG